MKKTALISVFDKKGIVDFAKGLTRLGWEIIATGGIYKTLKSAKLQVTTIEKVTGSPEILNGRVKTISYQIAAGILFNRGSRKHQNQVKKLNLPTIDMVVCNLYPFEKTISRRHRLNEAIEMIDVGGVTLLRAAAKNFKYVTTICDPKDYKLVFDELKNHIEVEEETKARLASKTFGYVVRYDDTISRYFAKRFGDSTKLRYGENPHQKGWFHKENTTDPLAIQKFKQLQGKELSFNNYLDISSVIDTLSEMGTKNPACVIVKHGSPSGGAVSPNIRKAYENAWYGGDTLASFGGIIGINREVNVGLATQMTKNKKFFEVLVAANVSKEAQRILEKRKKLTVLLNKALEKPRINRGSDFKSVRGGVIEQDFDSKQITVKDLKVVSKKKPNKKQIEDLLFAWKMVKVSKSNAITIVKNQTLISSGVGQQDRKEACRISVFKATDSARGKNNNSTPVGAVAATDAFFPFPDGPEILIKAGIKAISQPGGSIRDQETIDLCNKHGVTMVFTGIRAFKH
ncbi:MAG: bifunctional phosphoribosylaminoimidazolecarboxamide formyltransferase/IMP cyclohydrolase [Candidatus Woykebacteria bacterium RBG_19FT_COMBO_43_10]|uniref:Bifunctional purine biosynthesis protein PurH n=1 Tax=Candidatus Woykebacteria bacterium RBG_19FT_COMBO_43_10 TaxID=1802598 RepID=A0A1G1WLT1_9BACT|nr:MAG: bifunctional phosphoribosylaminoimidazolecarboxamide formyltransferase/IMP cyclohydrolase [Candidatus Woykebacteria bacterium RBG_19FT_COMBO_43_10]